MRYIATHDRDGRIAGVTGQPPNAPTASVAPSPGRFEVEVETDAIDLARLETEDEGLRTIRGLRVERDTARLVRFEEVAD